MGDVINVVSILAMGVFMFLSGWFLRSKISVEFDTQIKIENNKENIKISFTMEDGTVYHAIDREKEKESWSKLEADLTINCQ